jgi:hypothetical protein
MCGGRWVTIVPSRPLISRSEIQHQAVGENGGSFSVALKPGKARFLSARGRGARLRAGEGLPGGEFGDESREEVHEWRVPVQISGLCEKRPVGKSLHRAVRRASQDGGHHGFREAQFHKVELSFADAVRRLTCMQPSAVKDEARFATA